MKTFYPLKSIYCFALTVLFFVFTNSLFGQTLTSDKDDYPPGDIVILTGTGFLSGETVILQVLHEDTAGDNENENHEPWLVTADGAGNFVTYWLIPIVGDEAGASLKGTADGLLSAAHAEVYFTDAINPPQCSITGNLLPCSSVQVQYTGPGAIGFIYLWQIINNNTGASIAGPATTQTINVNVGNTPGTFVLQLKVTSGPSSLTCTKTVTVTAASACSITPVTPVCPGAQNIYSGTEGMTAYSWSISGNGSIQGSTTNQNVVVNANNVCNGSYTLTLNATINGCVSTCTQVISIIDNSLPTIGQPGANSTISCSSSPVFTAPAASDNCGTPAVIEVSDITTPGSCAGSYSRTKTWKAVDACLNESSVVSQTINVIDTTAPSIEHPDDLTISCPATPQFTEPEAADGCDTNPEVVLVSDITTPGGSPGVYSRTVCWKAVDCSGNESETICQTINVTNNTTPFNGTPVLACMSYVLPWGQTVTASGNYSHSYTSASGCDSTVTIHVTINPSYNAIATPVTACVSYTLPWGQVATSSNDYSHTYNSVNGCDSTVTIHVTINPSYNITAASVTACVSHTLPWGQTVTATNDYSHSYTSANGCDSTVTVHVTINPSYNVTAAPVTACVSYTLPWGQTVTSTNDYSHTYTSANGCDSTVTVHVTINPSYNVTSSSVTACVSYTLPWGQTVTSTNDYSHTYTSANGCDSTVTIHVTINPSYNLTAAPVTACVSYTLPWGQTVTASGNYNHSYTSVNGCDSTVTVHVTINSSYNVTTAPVTACVSYTLPWGQTVTSTNDYSHTYTSANGCDSTVTVHVTINPSYNVTSSSVTACVSYTLPWGQSVTASGNYNHSYTSVNGCDSSVTVHVTINPIYNVTAAPVTACVSYTLPWGQTVTASGNYNHSYTSVNGCDSSVTVHVTINPSYNVTAAPVTACVSYTLPWGQTVTATNDYSHSYTSANGCDSIVTVHVTINPGYNVTAAPVTACVSYTLPWGQTVTASGNYNHSYTSVNGCDSTVTIHVNINPSFNVASTSVSACMSYTLPWGQTVTSSNDYSHSYSSTNGCDSVVTFHVTINPAPTAMASSNSPVCQGGTLNLSSSGGMSYSWTGPNGFTSSLQNPTISNVAVSAAGSYIVTVTNSSGCTAMATTTVSINANPTATASSNPACVGTTLNLSASGGISYSWSGPNGFTSSLQNPGISNVTTAANGIYTVSVTSSSGCSAIATLSITVTSKPTATASSNSPVVGGSILNLTSTGGTTYAWTGPNAFTSTLQNPTILNASAAVAGTYTVTVSNASGCTATATTTVVVNCSGFKSYTITQGGWGANANGNNPAVYRDANFPYAFPNGLTLGCGTKWLNLTTSLAVQNFLPSGGTPNVLTQSYTNPGSSLSNTLAGQIAALALNVGFDNYDNLFAPANMHLKDMYVKSGTFMGWTVMQVLTEAQKKLGGCVSSYTTAQLNTVCASINENYDGGNVDKGFLSCIQVKMINPISIPEKDQLNLYPNPNNGAFVLELNLDEDITTTADIQILNMLGQVIYLDRTEAVDGKIRKEVKISSEIPSGNYLVRVKCNDEMYTGRIIYQQ